MREKTRGDASAGRGTRMAMGQHPMVGGTAVCRACNQAGGR